jgi:outer membrane protein assembly factor BamB
MAVSLADQPPGKEVMYALRASDGTILWKWNTCGESVGMTPPTVANGAVYFACYAAPSLYRLYALQAKTGTLLWRDTLSGPVVNTVLVNQQMLYIQQDNQLLVERADTGVLLWQQRFGESGYPIETVLGDGILYIRQGNTFFAEKASDGARMWEYRFIGGYISPEPIVDHNMVYLIASPQGRPYSIYALDGTTGTLYWQKPLDIGLSSWVVDHGNLYVSGTVFAASGQGYGYLPPLKRELLAIQGSDGRTLWQRDIPWNKGKGALAYAMMEPPVVSAGGGRVYLVDWVDWHQQQSFPMLQNPKVIMGAFSESNGALLWTRDVS